MISAVLLATQANLTITKPRFVYVDLAGYVRLYGEPAVRSTFKDARSPDLSPDGGSFVYWASTRDEMREHDLRKNTEKVLRKGNLRSPGYAADGKAIFFTEFHESWNLYALDRDTGKASLLFAPSKESNGFFEPRAQKDGTVMVQDMDQVFSVRLDGKVVWSDHLAKLNLSPGPSSTDVLTPSPLDTDLLVASFDTTDVAKGVAGRDGVGSAVWLVDAPRMTRKRLSPRTTNAMRPCWARDGSAILFVAGKGKAPLGIWTIRPDGTGLRFVVAGDEPSAGR